MSAKKQLVTCWCCRMGLHKMCKREQGFACDCTHRKASDDGTTAEAQS